jgi:hypothetical protein
MTITLFRVWSILVIIQIKRGDTGKNKKYTNMVCTSIRNCLTHKSQQKLTIKHKRNYGPTPYLQNIQEGDGTSAWYLGVVYTTWTNKRIRISCWSTFQGSHHRIAVRKYKGRTLKKTLLKIYVCNILFWLTADTILRTVSLLNVSNWFKHYLQCNICWQGCLTMQQKTRAIHTVQTLTLTREKSAIKRSSCIYYKWWRKHFMWYRYRLPQFKFSSFPLYLQ